MRLPVLILLVATLSTAACGGTPTSPSTTSSTPTTVTERFDAIINVKGSSFFPFSVGTNGGSVAINFASLSPLSRPGLLPLTMEIGYGTVVRDDDGNIAMCALLKVVQATPALTAQLTDPLAAGVNYCANIADVGALTESANFSIRITHS